MATDITYIKTHEGWLYLSVVIDLFSWRVVGWSAHLRMTTDLALQALLAAVWRPKRRAKVMIHSDQGSQFTSRKWQLFLGQHNLEASMSRRGDRHDKAVAERFFRLLKRERIRRRTYLTREAARQDVFDYIEMFYNPKRKHTNNGMLSPVDFETRQQKLNEAGVQKTMGTSGTSQSTTLSYYILLRSFASEIGSRGCRSKHCAYLGQTKFQPHSASLGPKQRSRCPLQPSFNCGAVRGTFDKSHKKENDFKGKWRCGQTNAKQSPFALALGQLSGRKKDAPLGESGGA
jgi:hypothetical protein